MATKMTRVCDIYGGTHKVEEYTLLLVRHRSIEDDPEAGKATVAMVEVMLHSVRTARIDLCPKALKRCKSFLTRAVSPPKAAEEESGDVEGQTTLDEIG